MEELIMFSCCIKDACNWNEKFDINIANSDQGVTINVIPKDKSKVKSLQKLVESYKDFCEGECC